MNLKKLWENRKIELTGLISLVLVTAINQIAQTPVIYILTVIVLAATVYASRKFRQQFDAKLFFTRSGGSNHWSGGFAGVLAGTMSLYTSSLDASFAEIIAVITAITTFTVLMTTLFYGSILEDIQKGRINV